MIDGGVHAGPNAVLAFAREGYALGPRPPARRWPTTLASPGSGGWPAALPHGLTEVAPVAVAAPVRRRACAGWCRSCATTTSCPRRRGRAGPGDHRDGRWSTTSCIDRAGRQVHVLNAPSPAATSALEIGRHVVSLLD